jgi:membrane-associated protein
VDALVDLFLHADQYLTVFVATYGAWVYALLFLIVFAETGLVITPILPGDSLLFAAGALAAAGVLDVVTVMLLLAVAGIVGNTVNYSIGRTLGPRVFHSSESDTWFHRLLNRQHLARAHAFFERYGAFAIIMGRFVPIVRTFVPFVAGIGGMSYTRYTFCNVVGSIAWVVLCVMGGYLFGNIPIVKNNFSLAMLTIVAVSLLPIVIAYLRGMMASRKQTLS